MRAFGLSVFVFAFAAVASPAIAQPEVEEQGEIKPLILPPRLVKFVEATYPPDAYAQNREASVELSLTIAANGRVTEAIVTTPVDEAFDQAALAAAQQFVFEPARRNWEPVPSRIRYNYVFEIKVDEKIAATTGRIVGSVFTGKQDKGVAEATVEIVGVDFELFRELLTDERGAFEAAELPSGAYKVRVISPEFGQTVQQELVEAGEVTELTYRLGGRDKRTFRGFGTTAVIDPPPREATRRTLRREELTRIPGTRGDALRAVQILPGVGRLLRRPITTHCHPDFVECTISHLFDIPTTPFEFTIPHPVRLSHIETLGGVRSRASSTGANL